MQFFQGSYWYYELLKYAYIIYCSFTDNIDVSQLKERLQLLTLGIGGVGVVCAYVSYTPEIAVRYEFLNFLANVEIKLESVGFALQLPVQD